MFYEIVLRVFWIFAFIIMYPILLVAYALEDAWTYINHRAQASERARQANEIDETTDALSDADRAKWLRSGGSE